MSLARTLWHENADLASAALHHPFVRGIADGTLPRAAFAAYVAQDAFYLESYARAYALAGAHCPDRFGIDAFAGLLNGLREELRLHESYAARWGVDLSSVTPAPATLAYTDFLLATAALGAVGQTCAAMTPCMRLYAYLGRSLAEAPVTGPYAEWIITYADPAFHRRASTLEDLFDRYADQPAQVRPTYRRAMWLELGFFDAAGTDATRS